MRTAISGESTVKEPSVYMGLVRGVWVAARNWVWADGSKAGVACCSVRPMLLPQVTKLVQNTGDPCSILRGLAGGAR